MPLTSERGRSPPSQARLSAAPPLLVPCRAFLPARTVWPATMDIAPFPTPLRPFSNEMLLQEKRKEKTESGASHFRRTVCERGPVPQSEDTAACRSARTRRRRLADRRALPFTSCDWGSARKSHPRPCVVSLPLSPISVSVSVSVSISLSRPLMVLSSDTRNLVCACSLCCLRLLQPRLRVSPPLCRTCVHPRACTHGT
jgi:hypothetical protein